MKFFREFFRATAADILKRLAELTGARFFEANLKDLPDMANRSAAIFATAI